ncbi:MAG: hypothetical protein JST81_02165 [Bacteroidetes bacterium]|nr:hypothetical protein [Bacteroidota bacterium]
MSLVSDTGYCQYHNFCNYTELEFNSDTCCWRKEAKADSFNLAATHILGYLRCPGRKVNKQSLYWHAGQMFACANDYTRAKHYCKKTYTVFTKWFGGKEGKAWYFYAKGTVAFLRGDKLLLQHIIKKWDRSLPKDKNYEALIKLYTKISLPYRDAVK